MDYVQRDVSFTLSHNNKVKEYKSQRGKSWPWYETCHWVALFQILQFWSKRQISRKGGMNGKKHLSVVWKQTANTDVGPQFRSDIDSNGYTVQHKGREKGRSLGTSGIQRSISLLWKCRRWKGESLKSKLERPHNEFFYLFQGKLGLSNGRQGELVWADQDKVTGANRIRPPRTGHNYRKSRYSYIIMAGAQTEESMLVVQTLGRPHLTPLTRIKQ